MLTYLYLHLNRWRKRPILYSLLFLFPLLCVLLLSPWLNKAAEDTAVPIGMVDLDQSSYSTQLIERVQKAERIRLHVTGEDQVRNEVQKGNLEGAFVIQKGFQQTIQNGEVEDTIQWIRTENSTLDVFAKEAIGAEMMRLALNAKAAVTLDQWGASATYDEAVTYADQFWEPDPLFQVEFSKRAPETPKVEKNTLSPAQQMGVSLLFFYAWAVAILFLHTIVVDEKKGQIDRILVVQRSTYPYFLGHFFVFVIIAIGIFLIGLNSLFLVNQISGALLLVWNGWGIGIMMITLALTWFLFMGSGRKTWMIYGLLFFAVGSFVCTTAGLGWTKAWPHSWLNWIV